MLLPPPHAVIKNDVNTVDQQRWDDAINGGDNAARKVGNATFALPCLSGVKLSSGRHPTRTLLVAEVPVLYPYSWHDPSSHGKAYCDGTIYNDARNEAGFVDGHVNYIKIYLKNYPEMAFLYNPPANYDYQWSPD